MSGSGRAPVGIPLRTSCRLSDGAAPNPGVSELAEFSAPGQAMWSSGHRVDEPLSSVGRLEVNWYEERPYEISRAAERLGFRVGLQQLDADDI